MNKSDLFYCIECIVPNTRPTISFNKNGICSACLNSKIKKKIDWKGRKINFLKFGTGSIAIDTGKKYIFWDGTALKSFFKDNQMFIW